LVIISTWTYLDVVVGPADAQGEPLSQTLHLATKAGLLEKFINKVFGFIRNLCLASNTKVQGIFKHYTTDLAGATSYLMDHLYASVLLPLGWSPATKGSLTSSFVANSIKYC
jgi:hypothetical protein